MLKRLVLVLCACACSGPPPPEAKCRPTGGFMSQPAGDGFGTAGDVLDIELRLAMSCPDSLEMRVTLSVLGPDNLPLLLLEGEASRVLLQNERTFDGAKTRVKVLAATPGAYHFTARFEPNLGQTQRDVLVAENHRDAGPTYVVAAGAGLGSCGLIDVTPRGRYLCRSAVPGQVRVFETDGGLLQAFTGAASLNAARVGDVLWLADSSELRRFVEGPSGYVQRPDAGWLTNGNPGLVAADETGALLATSFGTLFGTVVTDAGILFGQQFIGSGNVGAVWKRGDEYIVAGGNPFGQPEPMCSGRFLDGGACDLFNRGSVALASEPAGLWTMTRDPFTPELLTLNLHTGAAFRELVLPPGWAPPDAGHAVWDTAAVLRNGNQTLLVADKQGSFVLQRFPQVTPFIGATGSWAAFREGPNVLLYRR